jgi:hypothetical protein
MTEIRDRMSVLIHIAIAIRGKKFAIFTTLSALISSVGVTLPFEILDDFFNFFIRIIK